MWLLLAFLNNPFLNLNQVDVYGPHTEVQIVEEYGRVGVGLAKWRQWEPGYATGDPWNYTGAVIYYNLLVGEKFENLQTFLVTARRHETVGYMNFGENSTFGPYNLTEADLNAAKEKIRETHNWTLEYAHSSLEASTVIFLNKMAMIGGHQINQMDFFVLLSKQDYGADFLSVPMDKRWKEWQILEQQMEQINAICVDR